jgi:hypothetical protein
MKQTAVEWQHIELSKFLYGKSEFTDANDILIKAKEMEKEQIMNAWENGWENDSVRDDEVESAATKYYNETFNLNEK